MSQPETITCPACGGRGLTQVPEGLGGLRVTEGTRWALAKYLCRACRGRGRLTPEDIALALVRQLDGDSQRALDALTQMSQDMGGYDEIP